MLNKLRNLVQHRSEFIYGLCIGLLYGNIGIALASRVGLIETFIICIHFTLLIIFKERKNDGRISKDRDTISNGTEFSPEEFRRIREC